MESIVQVEDYWAGRYFLLAEDEGWYVVAYYSPKRKVPVCRGSDLKDVLLAAQVLSSKAAERMIASREYLNVSFSQHIEVKNKGGFFDPSVKAWYMPAYWQNTLGTPLDGYRHTRRLEFLSRYIDRQRKRLCESDVNHRIYLEVPYLDKDTVQARGAVYDVCRKSWFIDDETELTAFQKWLPPSVKRPSTMCSNLLLDEDTFVKPLWIWVPKEERELAKARGALMDARTGYWYVPIGAHPNDFQEWLTPPIVSGPKRVFKRYLESLGYSPARNKTAMHIDGQWHSFYLKSDRKAPSGRYVLRMGSDQILIGDVMLASQETTRRWVYPVTGLYVEGLH